MKLFIAILLCAGTFLCSAESKNERIRRSTPFCAVKNPPSKNPNQCETKPVSRCPQRDCIFRVREGKLNTWETVELIWELDKHVEECKVSGMKCSNANLPCKCRHKGKTLWEKAYVWVKIAGKLEVQNRWIRFTIPDGCMCAVVNVPHR
ncbi:uncharacterized protein LOC120333609 isoform X2 [Styela clava]